MWCGMEIHVSQETDGILIVMLICYLNMLTNKFFFLFIRKKMGNKLLLVILMIQVAGIKYTVRLLRYIDDITLLVN